MLFQIGLVREYDSLVRDHRCGDVKAEDR
jgi:hypothetical protein